MSYNYSTNPTQTLSSIYTFTANIIAYNPVTKVVTLDPTTPVNLSYGTNGQLYKDNNTYDIINMIKPI